MEHRLKAPPDPELQRRIQELIAYKNGGHNQDLVADIILNALKLLTDVEDRGDVRVIRTAVSELRYAFRLFKPYADKRKVTIFGSARTKLEEPEYRQAADFGRQMAAAGWMIITGAGPGIMRAGPRRGRIGKQLRRQHPSAVGGRHQPHHARATRSSSRSSTSSPASSRSSATPTPSRCFRADSGPWTRATRR